MGRGRCRASLKQNVELAPTQEASGDLRGRVALKPDLDPERATVSGVPLFHNIITLAEPLGWNYKMVGDKSMKLLLLEQ
jgi:hypothetical protein